MAALALLVSAGSLTLTYVRGRPPRPKMVITFEKVNGNPRSVMPAEREPRVLTRVENVGGGVAHKVVISRRFELAGHTPWLQLDHPKDWEPGTHQAWYATMDSPNTVRVQWRFPRSSSRQREIVHAYRE
jgi:hypothetical protein